MKRILPLVVLMGLSSVAGAQPVAPMNILPKPLAMSLLNADPRVASARSTMDAAMLEAGLFVSRPTSGMRQQPASSGVSMLVPTTTSGTLAFSAPFGCLAKARQTRISVVPRSNWRMRLMVRYVTRLRVSS